MITYENILLEIVKTEKIVILKFYPISGFSEVVGESGENVS